MASKDSKNPFYEFAAVAAGIIVVERESGRIQFINPEAQRISGYSDQQAEQAIFWDWFSQSDRELVIDTLNLKRTSEWHIVRDAQVNLRRKSGRLCSVSIGTGKVADEDLILVTLIDNEPRREIEKKLEDSYAQLIQTSKFVSLAEMAAGVAHEINNPLAIVHGLAEKLHILMKRQGVENSQAAETIEKIKATSMRASKIIDNLKTLSRPDHVGNETTEISLSAMIDAAVTLCQKRFSLRNVSLGHRIENGDQSFWANESQILQVLMNFLENACFEAERSEKKEIVIVGENLGDSICIKVLDSGKGVEPEFRDKIMEPFFTTKEVGEGTGLGLSLSKTIVERHGGELNIGSENDMTCFSIQLPIGKASNVAEEPMEFQQVVIDSRDLVIEDNLPDEVVDPSSIHILFVDDEPDLLEIVGYHLEKRGFRASLASNGQQALEIMMKDPADVILSDIRMPEMGGLDLLECVDRDFPETRFFVMTGSVNIPYDVLFSSGVEAIFSKPISIENVMDHLNRSLVSSHKHIRRKTIRFNFKPGLTLAYDANHSIHRQIVNIGRGGMFIALEGKLPEQGQNIHFELNLVDEGETYKVRGEAVVRWVREESDRDLKRGVGVEFSAIEKESAHQFSEFLNKLMSKSFIPIT